MMLLKYCTQYASKFEKLSNGHRTGNGEFSLQSQRKVMLKNVQTIAQLHSYHILAKDNTQNPIGFHSTWSKNFQRFKLDFKKAEETEIKLQTSIGSLKKHENSRKNISFCFIDFANAFDCIDLNKLWKILRDRNARPPNLPSEKSVCRSRNNS